MAVVDAPLDMPLEQRMFDVPVNHLPLCPPA
jgi:hypothetical protein